MTVNAVIIVGGPSNSSDFRPFSLQQPKPLFPVAGRPFLWHHLRALSQLQCVKEVFIVGFYEAPLFADFIDEARQTFALRIKYACIV